MKRALAPFVLCLGAQLYAAVPPTYDGFDYPAGSTSWSPSTTSNFNAQGYYWNAAGTATPAPAITIAPQNLSVPGLAQGTGNSVRVGTNGNSARFSFPSPVNNGSLYYSFALRVADVGQTLGVPPTGGGFWAGFNNTAGTQAATPTTVGTKMLTRATVDTGGTRDGGYNIGLVKASTTASQFSWDPRRFTPGDVVFIVGCYTYNPGSNTDDLSKLWINPNPSSFGAAAEPPADLISTAGTDVGQLLTFVFLQRNRVDVQPAASITDELRIGNSWAEVTPPGGTQQVFVTDFFPREGGEGTLLTINGGGFGNNPDDHCAILKAGNRFIDIEVLTATPTQLVARVGVIPPEFLGPLQLMVGVGQGERVPLCPEARDVIVAPDNWIWRGDAQNGATAQQPFFATAPVATAAAGTPPLCHFHSSGPAGGELQVSIDKDWVVGARYCISARVHAQGTGADTRIGPATFTATGSRFDCAVAICDLLRKAFASHPQRPINIRCTVTNGVFGPLIIVSLPGGPIDGGNIDIIQKEPPPIITGLWDIHNTGLWRKEVRKRELARWYRHYEWVTRNSIWFERRAEGVWITREALESFTCQSHCIYRFPNGRVWVIWRTFRRVDLRRFWVHHRFYWTGRANTLAAEQQANRMAMTIDDLQIVLPMTPQDPNPATPFNEAVMIVDENGQQHFQGQPGFEVMPDVAQNPSGFQLAGTAQSTVDLPPAPDRIQDIPMQPMPGMAQLSPGVIIQWLVDKNGNVLVDHNQDGWPDPLLSPHVLGAQKHQGLIAPPTGTAGASLAVDQGNNQLQLFCWELDPNGEVLGAMPGQIVIGPPVDLDGDGTPDNAAGAPVPMDPTVREMVVSPNGIQEVRDPNAKPVEIAVIEEAPPTDAQLADFNQRMAAQIPGFVPLQRPLTLCISRINVRRIWGIDRRYVFDTWLHHWIWRHRVHVVLRHRACRVWLTKVSLSHFSSSHHHHHVGLPPSWSMYDLTQVRFFRVCFRVVAIRPNEVALKVDQMHVVVPVDPSNPNSQLMLLSTQGDENKLFQEVPPPVLAGLQPDPLPVGPDGVFVEPIDPLATLDIGVGGTGVLLNRPLEARGMGPAMLLPNQDDPAAPKNNQLQLYCWALNPNGTIAMETFALGVVGVAQPITLAQGATPALPLFADEFGNMMDNATMFDTMLMSADNEVQITRAGTRAELSWEGYGHVEAAPNVTGPWQDVTGAVTSPVTVDLDENKRFFRIHR